MLGIAESTYYDRKKRLEKSSPTKAVPNPRGRPAPGYSVTMAGKVVEDDQIIQWLYNLLEGEEHVYGYKLLTRCIRDRYQVIINAKKMYRLCKQLGILRFIRGVE
jgi:putative transposase